MTIKLELTLPYAGKLAGETHEVDTDAEADALEGIGLAKRVGAPAKSTEKAGKTE